MDVKNFYKILLAFFVFSVFVFGFTCYNLGRGNVQNNGTGVEPVRNELGNAQKQQREAVERTEQAIERTDRIKDIATTDSDLIGQCQQILRGVRQRGKS